jgi:hypothetical protein
VSAGGSSRDVKLLENAEIATCGPPCNQPLAVLKAFLLLIAEECDEQANALIAPTSKKNGDLFVRGAKLDFESFRSELFKVRELYDYRNLPISDSELGFEGTGLVRYKHDKFRRFQVIDVVHESRSLVKFTIRLDGWDTDETHIVCEDGQWYVADPIHIIR